MNKGVFEYIITEEAAYKTRRVPVTNSKDWNMYEHIQRCTNVANGWFHSGKNDGLRPYDNIVTPIVNVARRSEGFDVKDIEPYVNDEDNFHKSFLVRKYHPKWARDNDLDTFLDDLVESSVIYDLALVKDVKGVRPEVVPLQQIAFCDQTDVLAGALCLKHDYSVAELKEYSDKWYGDKIDEAITMAQAQKSAEQASSGQKVETPSKYIEVYELHGYFPETWLDPEGDPNSYTPQLHIVTFYKTAKGDKRGICLFKGKERKPIFKALVVNKIYGRACGMSTVELLFDPQVWTNYSEIKIKKMLDNAAMMLVQTADEKLAKKTKLNNLEGNEVLHHEEGKELTQVSFTPQNLQHFVNHKINKENSARILGSASDAQLGTNPVSGTPFSLQALVVQQGQGIHEWRQGKIATFVTELYRDWILQYLVNDMNSGKKFLEQLSIEELQELAERVSVKRTNDWIRQRIMEKGKPPSDEERNIRMEAEKEGFIKTGVNRFMEIVKGELQNIPVDVLINIKQKQKDMAKAADSITNILREVIKNPDAFRAPGLGKAFNELLENSGFSPINFAQLTKALPAPTATPTPPQAEQQTQPQPVLTT